MGGTGIFIGDLDESDNEEDIVSGMARMSINDVCNGFL